MILKLRWIISQEYAVDTNIESENDESVENLEKVVQVGCMTE